MALTTWPVRDHLSKWYGRVEYCLRPGLSRRRGGPFNGQVLRQACYGELLRKFGFDAIIETGAYRGITTKLFAESNVPVYSIETNPRFAAYAETRLRIHRNAQVLLGDSRARLRDLAADPSVPKQNVFFYLDAHWYDDLPLLEEVQIINSAWQGWIAMVDDFEVPGSDYAYDDYGPGKALTLSYLQPAIDEGLSVFFPRHPAQSETGARRGSVVICNDVAVQQMLEQCRSLTAAREPVGV